jgi:hypothetical protein
MTKIASKQSGPLGVHREPAKRDAVKQNQAKQDALPTIKIASKLFSNICHR